MAVPARAAVALSLLLVWIGSSERVEAQTATALDRFEPAPAGDELLSVPSPEVLGHLRPAAGFVLSYARSPLILAVRDGGGRDELGEVVDHQLVLHNLLSLELFHRLKAELDVPVTLSQGGDGPRSHGIASISPSGAAMNDVRGGVRLEVLAKNGWWPAAAVSLTGWFPSGDDGAYASAGVTRFAPALVLGTSREELAWSLWLARRFEPATAGAGNLRGSELLLGVGVAPRFGPLQIGAELSASTVAERGIHAFSESTTSVEALIAARYALGPVAFRLAGGPGLTAGVGTPRYRLLASVIYATEPGAADEDDGARSAARDDGVGQGGVAGDDGAAPAGPAPSVSTDRDGDGVPDGTDDCPAVMGDPAAKAPRRGCPPDRDGDGVADGEDRCPDVPGVRSSDPKRDGCPADSDGDGILDGDDACPREKGTPSAEPKTHGCPKLVRVVGTQIVIQQQVHFKTGKSELDPSSEELLRQVAQLLGDHPEIARIAVDGHTDDVGGKQANVALSQRRALAVVRWLNGHGVDARRTEARGFGPNRPLVPNDSDEQRAKNRRVEFQILLRDERGEAGWRDGPVR